MASESFPPSLIETIDRLVKLMHPVLKAQANAEQGIEVDKKHTFPEDRIQVFHGLALPEKAPHQDTIRDILAILEALKHEDASREAQQRQRKLHDSCSTMTKFDYDKQLDDLYDASAMICDSATSSRCNRDNRYVNSEPRRREVNQRLMEKKENSLVLHGIYDGHVTGLKDFGAFVSLDSVNNKVKGLVHVSRLANERSSSL
jgi:ATP-dependent RNA helicase DHX8/PRP22